LQKVKHSEQMGEGRVETPVNRVIVIGSGIAGLATSIRLAHAGFSVTVFEASDGPGGKLREKRMGDFRFDLGPSLFTLPGNVDELFELCGERPKDHFRYSKLEVLCHYFWNDGMVFHAPADKELWVRNFANHFGEKEEHLRSYLSRSEFIFDRTAPVFLHRSLHQLKWFSAVVRRGLAALPRLPMTGSLARVNNRYFRNPRAVQYFNRFATYNGSDPWQAPAMMMLIPHLEHGVGAFLPEGGMGSITSSLYALARRKGVKFRFNEPVDEILLTNERVHGVRTSSGVHSAEVVVSNMDMHPTYRKLLPHHAAPEKLLAQEKSSSALIFYWGIKATFPQLDVHNIFFADDYRKEFACIFESAEIHSDPTVYINITAKTEPDDAPRDGENWFVMINVPHQRGQNWDEMRKEARRSILSKLSRSLGQEIEPLIAVEDYLDPVRIETRTSSYLGALYGNASNSPYAAFLRHSNESSMYSGLYFAGGSVHPGGGIPLCLFGAKITADLIASKYTHS